jgi:hypothetical protein
MAKPKLCEIIAVVSGKKGEVEKAVTEAYHKFQKGDLFDGLSRTYRPRTEDGEQLPSESKQPQLRVTDLITEACMRWGELFDLTLTLDAGNCIARADVEVDGKVVVKDIPVSTLLFLEKQLANIHAFVSKLPTPDPAEVWSYNDQQDMLTTNVRQTARTKKVQKPLVLFPATKEHPAQTQLITEDVIAGDWSQTLFTTRIPAQQKNDMLARVGKLQDAVKVARERANGIEVERRRAAEAVLGFVFGDLAKKG